MKNKILLTIILVTGIASNTFGGVYFLKDGSSGDALTPETATGSITNIFTKISPTGNDTIVVCGDFGLAANFTETAHSGEIVITQVYNGVDYRNNEDGSTNSFFDKTTGRRYILNGPTKFENINFGTSGSKYILFVANFHPITMGEGITVDGFTYTDVPTAISIVGGYQGNNVDGAKKLNPSITIESGKFIVIGFNRDEKSKSGAYTGTAQINISGGEITNLYGGSANLGTAKGGNLNLNITGGTFSGKIYAGHFTLDNNLGVVNSDVMISGGDFSTCQGIIGLVSEEGIAEGGTSSINYCLHPNYSDIDVLVSGFTTVEECYTSIEEEYSSSSEQFEIFVNGKNIRIDLKNEIKPVMIFDMSGRVVYNGYKNNITLSETGVYAIRVGQITKKILIK